MEQEKELTIEQRIERQTQEIISRLTCFSGWHLFNQNIGLGLDTMIRELYVQMAFNHAAVIALSGLVTEKFEIPPITISKRVNAFLEQRLDQMQQQYRIKITPEETYSVDENGEKIEGKETVQ